MPLVNMKSNLSKIERAFGSDTTTAGSTVATKTIGVDKDLNTSKLPRTNFLDLKGDMILKGYTSETKYVRTTVDENRDPTPIQILHKGGRTAGAFQGFTYSAISLKDYYAQAKGNGKLGYRNNDVTGFDQPFIIRDIGDRWGKYDSFGLGDSKLGNTIEGVIKFGAGLIDSIGGAVLGRTPSEYIGNAIAGLERTGKFLLTPQGVSFLAKQDVLMKTPKAGQQEFRTDAKYGLTSNLLKLHTNLKKYNILSLASLPGVTKININPVDPTLIIKPYMDTIESLISNKALGLAREARTKIINFADTFIAAPIKDYIGKKLNLDGQPVYANLNTVKQSVDGVLEQAEQARKDAVKLLHETLSAPDTALGKATQMVLPNAKILSEVGVDKVNMIPYGTRIEKEKTADDALDFIPFRFEDMGGNRIVFRALLSAITDAFTPNYAEQKYIGRPDKVYVYTGTDRLVSFTFDIYPKSDQELVRLWEKMNYLAGLTYPSWEGAAGGGSGMVAPFCKLTIGDMFKDTPGYISGLTYTVQDTTTWETTFAKLPKYIQAQCTFVYIGKRLPASNQKQYEAKWISETKYTKDAKALASFNDSVSQLEGLLGNSEKLGKEAIATIKGLPFGASE
jgi:hypothetical protein